ncbi:MAG: response regulator [Lentisphaerae bacterium]|nr:response regulator [Lentisphaerota bacterium]
MGEHDPTSTMRIDIRPDLLGQSLARKRQVAAAGAAGDTSFLVLEAAARHRSAEFRKLIESIYDAVLIADAKGRIVDFNTRATEFFVCPPPNLGGLNVLGLISGADDALLATIQRNLGQHRYTLIEAHCLRLDKSTFPAEIAVNRVDLDEQCQLCFLVRDISVRKRAQEALEDAVRRLAEHDRARSEFVSHVSHELRTPLTSMIYGIANLLRGVGGPLPPEVRRYVELLEGDSKRLLSTVNDILDLRQAEMKTLKLAKSRVPFGRLVERGVNVLRVQAESKGVGLEVAVRSQGRFVDCDAHKMERVVLNIVGNAVKFTGKGGAIDVTVEDDPDRAGFVRFVARDTGVGIPPEAVGRVMEMYFTVGEQASGSGLGLAISKQIVEFHGGAIRIFSPPPGRERGTEVRVSLPAAPPPCVLVVEDRADVSAALAGQIARHGYRVVEVASAAAALAALEKERPSVVVLDLVLPDMPGRDLILKLKADQNISRIPVVVVTGADVDARTARVLDGFSITALGKPWNEEELMDHLEGTFMGTARIGV